MSVAVTVDDLSGYGRHTITEHVRDNGTVAYRVAGPRVHGTVLVRPDVRDDQPVPDRLIVQFGDGDHRFATQLQDLLTIDDAVILGGAASLPPDGDAAVWARRLRLTQLANAGRVPQPLTEAQLALVAVLLGVIADRCGRLDQAALMIAAARHTAGGRLRRWVHAQILPDHALHAETGEELAAAYQVADRLQQLSSLTLLPTGPACACAGRLPCVDLQSLIVADDDGDWLTCTRCGTATVLISPGDSLLALLAAHAEHTCPTR